MPLTQEQLDNAGLDADSFGAFVNGNSGVTVTTRTGQTYPSVARIVSKLESGFYAAPTWAALAAFDAAGMVAGQAAKVFGPDLGTHTDPVVGGTVPNVGIYARSTSPAGWQRIAGLEADDAEAWAEGTEPGGPGTKSAKEWAESIPDIYEELPESDWALRVGSDGGPSVGFLKDGRVIGIFEAPPFDLASAFFNTPVGARKLMPSPDIVALGDSTAEGAGASGSVNAWRTLLGTALGITIVNKGIGGSNAQQIAARYGAIPTTLTVSGDSIPASGTVSVTAISPAILFNGGSTSTRALFGTINGNPVRLWAESPAGTYTIEQVGASGSLAVSPGSTFVPDDGNTVYQDAYLIVCAGTNNISGDIYAAAEAIKAIAYRNRPYFKKVFIVSPRNNASTGRMGSSQYDNMIALNRLLASYFGDNFLDLRSFLMYDALGCLGLTPTAQDITDVEEGCIPEQLRADSLHSNDTGHQAEAWFFERVLKTRGFV